MDSTIISSPESPVPEKKIKTPKAFGWTHLFIRVAIILVIVSFFSYLQAVGTMSVKELDSLLIVPAISGLLMSVLNWRYLVKISVILLPVWFAASIAIAFSGVIIINLVEMPYEQGDYWWLDLVFEFLPAFLAGHWLYSGYSRMSKGISFWGWFIIVGTNLLLVFLIYRADINPTFLQPAYFTIICAGLCLMHFKKQK